MRRIVRLSMLVGFFALSFGLYASAQASLDVLTLSLLAALVTLMLLGVVAA